MFLGNDHFGKLQVRCRNTQGVHRENMLIVKTITIHFYVLIINEVKICNGYSQVYIFAELLDRAILTQCKITIVVFVNICILICVIRFRKCYCGY